MNQEAKLQIWREAMAQLRHLADDVWRGLKIFLSLNALILTLITVLVAFRPLDRRIAFLLLILSLIGIFLTLTARYILKRHRIYYVQMLLKKTLLEEELGFYEAKFVGTEIDFAFPWRLTPEVISELKRNPEQWVEHSVRSKGSIARFQFLIYEMVIGIYAFALVFIFFRVFLS